MSQSPSEPYASLPRVARAISGTRIVLNKGEQDGITLGQRFLIFGLGEEIFDPQTKERLGRLEEIRGTVRVIHLQPKIATAESDKRQEYPTTVKRRTNPFFGLGEIVEETSSAGAADLVDLFGVKVGDLARPVLE